MGRQYEQLTESERQVIGRLHAGGRSQREIARTLQRDPSTINRELRRNSRPTKVWPGGYRWRRAQGLTDRRRRRSRQHKLARQPDLRDLVRGFLAMGWSPGQIAGRLALLEGGMTISHESIYRYVYHRTGQKDYWNRLLPRAKHRRGRPGRKGGSPVDTIKHRVSIALRPAAAETRATVGHWESDLMAFSKPGQVILLAQERACRYILLPGKTRKLAATVVAKLKARFRHLPDHLRATLTLDNGTEFARHYELARLGLKTFFCDPHAPWQKGGIENAIGRLRRYLPRGTDLDRVSPYRLRRLADRYNNTPRKCLGFQTPAEVFEAFKRQSGVALET
jgi:transposase, IS30 family